MQLNHLQLMKLSFEIQFLYLHKIENILRIETWIKGYSEAASDTNSK